MPRIAWLCSESINTATGTCINTSMLLQGESTASEATDNAGSPTEATSQGDQAQSPDRTETCPSVIWELKSSDFIHPLSSVDWKGLENPTST